MNIILIGLACAVAALVGAFLPIAAAGPLYVNIGHLGGTAWLLYVIPVVAVALWLVAVYRPQVQHLSVWLATVALGGLITGVVTVRGGMGHVNSFLAMERNFNESSVRFQQEFSRMFDGGSPLQENQAAAPREEESLPSARPALGGLMVLGGYLGMIGAVLSRRKKLAAVVAMLAFCFAARPGFAAEPRPFGLVLGSSTKQDALKAIQAEGGTVTRSGNRIVSGEIINPAVEGMIVEGLRIEGLEEARFWFMSGTLMAIDYDFPASMSKAEFYRLLDQLREKYGRPAQLRVPQLADGLAVWKSGSVETRLSVPWVASTTVVIYRHVPLWKKAAAEDKKVYEQETRAAARRQKGL